MPAHGARLTGVRGDVEPRADSTMIVTPQVMNNEEEDKEEEDEGDTREEDEHDIARSRHGK